MADVKDFGELYTSDILVIGGGMAGLVTAIRAKENDPNLDILVVDKGIIGWNGQATKAGNGIRATAKNPDAVMNAMKYLVHAHTPFMNDQEFLKKYLEVHVMTMELQYLSDHLYLALWTWWAYLSMCADNCANSP